MNSPVLMVALPLLAAFVLGLAHRYRQVGAALLGPGVLLINLAIGLSNWQLVAASGPQAFVIGGFAAPLGIVFYADAMAVLMALAVSAAGLLLWPRGELDRPRESALVLLLVGGACGLALSGDLFNAFVFYELIAVAGYGLAASSGSGAAFAAALRFLLLSALGSAFALLGIALVYAASGTLNLAQLAHLSSPELAGPLGMAAFVLLLIGFGVKAELFPMNTWVPEVYGAAPARVSALLAGVVSKLALLLLMRLFTLVFAGDMAGQLLLVVGLVTLVSGELAAYRCQDLRRVLGYSSIGQMGLVVLAFSVSGTAGVLAGMALALHHLVAKPALFLLADAWQGSLARLQGAAASSPLAAVLFTLVALSLIGVPPLPGFWAKYLLLRGLLVAGDPGALLAVAVVLAVTVIEAAYLLRIVRTLFRAAPVSVRGPALLDRWSAAALGGTLVAGAVFAAPLGALLGQVAAQMADVALYIGTVQPLAAPLGGL